MEVPTDVRQRLIEAGQIHLLKYWSELNDDQRRSLLHDIDEMDFHRVRRAYEAIKSELSGNEALQTSVENGAFTESIDDVMEPIPDEVKGSINEANASELDKYRQAGMFCLRSSGNVVGKKHFFRLFKV